MITGRSLGGYLLTFEGPDGAGKSTQLTYFKETLDEMGVNYLFVREPGGTNISEQIRNVLHHIDNREMHPKAEVLLYQGARAQLVQEKIIPRLKEGGLVVCDRFYDSTLAYQGYGHGLDLEELHELINFATGGLTPDRTLLIDIDAERGLKRRMTDTKAEWNRLDGMALDFHRKVREGYLLLAKEDSGRFVIVDGARDIEEVRNDIDRILKKDLQQAGYIEGNGFGRERK